MPALVDWPRVVLAVDDEGLALRYALQFDVRAHAVNAHLVGVVEVVAQVELAEPERNCEAGKVGGLGRCAVEGYVEVGPSEYCISTLYRRFWLRLRFVGDLDVQVNLFHANFEGLQGGF